MTLEKTAELLGLTKKEPATPAAADGKPVEKNEFGLELGKPKIRCFKVLNFNGTPRYGDMQYDMPRGGKPGAWAPVIEDLDHCRTGYHFTTLLGLKQWIQHEHDRVFEIEYAGKVEPCVPDLEANNYDLKYCAQSIRLVREINVSGLKFPHRDNLVHKAQEQARSSQLSEIPEMKILNERKTAILSERKKFDDQINDIDAEIVKINNSQKVKIQEAARVFLKDLYDQEEAKVLALPAKEVSATSLEVFAVANRMRLTVKQVSPGYSSSDMPGPQSGTIVASLNASVQSIQNRRVKVAARGNDITEALTVLCHRFSGMKLIVQGVVLPDGSPYVVEAPILVPRSLLGNENAEKILEEAAAANRKAGGVLPDAKAPKAKKATPKAEPPAKKSAKKGKRS